MNRNRNYHGGNPRYEVARRKTVLLMVANELEDTCVMAQTSETGCVFNDHVLERLTRVEIWDLDDLLEVERILDALAAGGGEDTCYYRELREDARTFLLTHHMESNWPRSAGAVYELLKEVKLASLAATRVLAKFRLNKEA